MKWNAAGGPPDPIPYVDHSSPYLVFLFVLPPTDLEHVFGDAMQHASFEEYLHQGDLGVPVTTGLYLPSTGISDDDIEQALRKCLYL